MQTLHKWIPSIPILTDTNFCYIPALAADAVPITKHILSCWCFAWEFCWVFAWLIAYAWCFSRWGLDWGLDWGRTTLCFAELYWFQTNPARNMWTEVAETTGNGANKGIVTGAAFFSRL